MHFITSGGDPNHIPGQHDKVQENSKPKVCGVFAHEQTRSAYDSTLKRRHSYHVEAIMAAFTAFTGSMWFYQVRELVAALAIFSILFVTVGMALLILYSIENLAVRGMARLEARVAYARSRHAALLSQRDNRHV